MKSAELPAQLRTIPLLDLRGQFESIRDEATDAVLRVLQSQKLILGEEVHHLEREFAAYCATVFAIGCASGSDALFLSLRAAGIGPGDHVLTTPYTFFATVGAICRAGATPVFVDVEPDTFNIDVAAVEKASDKKPIKAMIPIHLFGACADMDPLLSIAEERAIVVIEDAAQSVGSEYKGRRAGSIGHIGCFSFYPSKNLGAFGDGGMLTTQDPSLADKLAALRVHGSRQKYYHEWIGVNSRLDALQAAVLRVKLGYLDQWTARRQANADVYRREFERCGTPIALPIPKHYQTRHVYNQFVICGESRDELRDFLTARGIGTDVYYPLPLHLQPCFAYLGYKRGDFPVSERLADTSIALPVYPELCADDIKYVCAAIDDFYGR